MAFTDLNDILGGCVKPAINNVSPF